MLYPQITGEPNFILIGVSAVFGLLVIIMVYYIVVSKSKNPSRLYRGGLQSNIALKANNLKNNNAGLNSTATVPTSTMPVPINSGGYYSAATVPTATNTSVLLKVILA